jgi:DNA-binding NarL/FixJ family response regulator
MTPQPTSIIRVAVVEDRQPDRELLAELLNASPGFCCVSACRSAAEALEALPVSQPDIVLMDIGMPGMSGIDCVRHLSELLPAAQTMMLTVLEDHELIFQSLAAGATGYLLKKTPAPRLLEAIRELRAGGAPMSGQVARKVVATFRRPSADEPPAARLSPVELEVLQLLARGLLYKEVADRLGISLSTVRTHVWHIYRKLQVHNRTEAILKLPSRTSSVPPA